MPEIVGHPVDKQMVAADKSQFQKLLAFLDHLAIFETRALRKIIRGIGREPERVTLPSHPERLLIDQAELFCAFESQLSTVFRHGVKVMNTRPAKLKEPVETPGELHIRPAPETFGGDPPQRGLRRTRWNGHRLKEKSAQGQNDSAGDKKYLDVFAHGSTRIWLELRAGDLFKLLHPLLDFIEFYTRADCGAQLARNLEGFLDFLRRQQVPLGVNEFADLPAHIHRLSHLLGQKPSQNECSHVYAFNTSMKASCGMFTEPTDFIRFFPAFCFSSSLRLREMSPP